ncbi:MAG: hypothetical protein ACYC9L_11510 [Sulfuricaulis sp.]
MPAFDRVEGALHRIMSSQYNYHMSNLHESPQDLLSQIPGLAIRWRAGEFDAAVFAALYFLTWQIAVHGQQFASRKRKNDPRPDAAKWLAWLEATRGDALRAQMLDWLERYQFRGVTANIAVALVQWLKGSWPLLLREDIPSPRSILRWQARGIRVVTVLTAYPRLREPVLNKPDAFTFFQHDLEHAYKFFYSPALHAGQCEFFAGLEAALDHGKLAPYFDDAGFVAKFHYLMSDMNTHPEHSRQYLRAILIEFHLCREYKTLTEPLTPAAEQAIESVLHFLQRPRRFSPERERQAFC